MARSKKPLLGRRLLSCLERVTDLMEAVKDEDELEELGQNRARLLKLLGQLVEAHLKQASAEYRAATKEIEAANRKIAQAIENLKMVAEAIKRLGQALDLVAKLVAA